MLALGPWLECTSVIDDKPFSETDASRVRARVRIRIRLGPELGKGLGLRVRVRVRARVRIRLGLGLGSELGLGLGSGYTVFKDGSDYFGSGAMKHVAPSIPFMYVYV